MCLMYGCTMLYFVTIIYLLKPLFFQTPSSPDEWLAIAEEFERKWNFPHVLGAVDGKHVRIRCPRRSGSLYYNYKHYFSIVMLAVVDANYKFVFVDAGAEGRSSDSRIWRQSDFFLDIDGEDNKLGLPGPARIHGIRGVVPYFFVGDDAFPLGIHLMKPFPASHLSYEQRIYNYRLSRCRRIVENAFGILSCRFRLFLRQQDMEPLGAKIIVMTAVALHNYLRTRCGDVYMPVGSIDHEDREHHVIAGQWREQPETLDPVLGHQMVRHRSADVKNLRDALSKWCLSKSGEVPWQYRIVQ